MLQRERSIAALLGCGLSPRLAARAYTTLARYTLGFAIQLVDQESPGQHEIASLPAAFQSLDSTAFPSILAVAGELSVPIEDEFAFGLELMIRCLEALTTLDTNT